MKGSATGMVLIALCILVSEAQTQPAAPAPVNVSVCEIEANPDRYDGRIVRVRAQVLVGFEVSALMTPEPGCDNARIWFSFGGRSATAYTTVGRPPEEPGRRPVTLKTDAAFRRFQRALDADARLYVRENGGACECKRFEVTATLVGRLDHRERGFGHLNGYDTQFVLASVEAVETRTIRYDPAIYTPKAPHISVGTIVALVVDGDGKPVPNQWVYGETTDEARESHEMTDAHGRAVLRVPPGDYRVIVNLVSPPSAKTPFPVTFFPGVVAKERATIVRLVDGARISITIRLPRRLELRDVALQVLSETGEPVARTYVWLSDPAYDEPNRLDETGLRTDANGKAVVKAIAGRPYVARANTPGRLPFMCGETTVSADDTRATVRLTKSGSSCVN